MKRACLLVLVVMCLIVAGCGGETSPSASSTDGGDARTLDPCALLTDAEIEAALGDAVADTVSNAQFDFVTCQYLGELRAGEDMPNLFIQVRTDQTISDAGSSGLKNAAAYWESFYGELVGAKTEEVSDTSYYSKDSLTDVNVLVEEVPDLGEHALFYLVEETTTQLWLHKDYAVFSISLTVRPADEGTEKDRLMAAAKSILAAMP
jgi:hypothetical protein